MSHVRYEKIKFNTIFIIKRIFIGEISIPLVMESFDYLLKTEFTENNTISAIITDLTQATLKFNLIEFRGMISFIRHNKILAHMPLALVVDSPINSMFASIASKGMGIKVKSFDSFEKAAEWANDVSQKK